MLALATNPTPTRASLWRQRRRLLEPWLFGLCGFSLTAVGMLIRQEGLPGQPIAALLEQISAITAS